MLRDFDDLGSPGRLRLVDRFEDEQETITPEQRSFLFGIILAQAHELCTVGPYHPIKNGSIQQSYYFSPTRSYTTAKGRAVRLRIFRGEWETSLEDPTIHEEVGLAKVVHTENSQWAPIAQISAKCIRANNNLSSSALESRYNLEQDGLDLLSAVGLFLPKH